LKDSLNVLVNDEFLFKLELVSDKWKVTDINFLWPSESGFIGKGRNVSIRGFFGGSVKDVIINCCNTLSVTGFIDGDCDLTLVEEVCFPETYSLREIAIKFKISKWCLRRLIRSGRLPYKWDGVRYLISEKDLERSKIFFKK